MKETAAQAHISPELSVTLPLIVIVSCRSAIVNDKWKESRLSDPSS